ncbi:hypothetical protein AALP_AA8G093800 [Arabis alpina]|uniref:Uncharacterized protein n=1 Tax=Arabis alpina TaxID=50452 RepID=A0A087G5Z1_ARAAL|nr:hypothetical protein AALP_AA8G093800 [Arabis alpina]
MERDEKKEDGDSSYLCIPFNFIHEIFRSFFVHDLRSPHDNFPIPQEEEETEVLQVTSRSAKQNTSSGRPGRIN